MKQPNFHEQSIYCFENGLTLYGRVENAQILNPVIAHSVSILGALAHVLMETCTGL